MEWTLKAAWIATACNSGMTDEFGLMMTTMGVPPLRWCLTRASSKV